MRVGVYAHPWNVDRSVLEGWQQLGVHEVALAVSYHAGRWLSPVEGPGLVYALEDGVVHFGPSGDYGRLQPMPSAYVGATSPLRSFLSDCRALGIEPHAWVVLFHNSRLGRSHPDLCVRNALGDVYTWALCPQQPAVREYGLGVLRDLGRHDGLAVVELEAAGFFGYRHSSHHDKSAFAADSYLDFLLSYCFCEPCIRDLDAAGVDGREARLRVAQLLRRSLIEGDAMQSSCFTHLEPSEDLPAEMLAALQRRRTQAIVDLLQAYRSVLPASVRMISHLVPDPLFTGSQLGLPAGVASAWLDGVLLTHYGQDVRAIRSTWETWRLPSEALKGEKCRLCIWPKAPQFVQNDDLADIRRLAQEHRLAAVRVYHAGLLPARTMARAISVLSGDQPPR